MSSAQPDTMQKVLSSKKGGRWADIALQIVLLLILFLAPLVIHNDYYVHVGVMFCMFAAMSVGWNLIGGYANQTSLGHAVFFALGAYTTTLLELRLHVTPWLGILAGVIVSIVLAILIGWPTFRLSGHYFALATLALLQIGDIVFTYFDKFTGGSSGLIIPIMHNAPGMLQFASNTTYFYVSAVLLVITLAVAKWVLRSSLGYRLLAIKGNPDAALLAGVNMMKTKLIALMISGALVGMIGGFYAEYMQYIDPNSLFSFTISINMALFAIIGGVDFWWGPIIGAIILVPLSQYTSTVLTGKWSPLGEAIYGALLILVILVKPRGIGEWLAAGWDRLVRRGANEST